MKAAALLFVFVALFSAYQCEPIAVRVVNALSNAPNIAVYFGNALAFNDIDFGGVTQYRDIDSGVYNVRVVQENNGALIYEIKGMELNDEHITVVAHGSVDDQDDFPYALAKLVDDNEPDDDRARVRFYHAAAGVSAVNFDVNNSTVFENLAYTDLSDYQNVNEGYRQVEVYDARGNLLVTSILPFDDGTIVNLYLAGTPNVSSDRLTLIIAIDIESGNRDESESSASVIAYSFAAAIGALALI